MRIFGADEELTRASDDLDSATANAPFMPEPLSTAHACDVGAKNTDKNALRPAPHRDILPQDPPQSRQIAPCEAHTSECRLRQIGVASQTLTPKRHKKVISLTPKSQYTPALSYESALNAVTTEVFRCIKSSVSSLE